MKISKEQEFCVVAVYVSNFSLTQSPQGLEFVQKKGDLFSCSEKDALAHCVSADFRMGKGIAVLFKQKFGGVQELKDQRK